MKKNTLIIILIVAFIAAGCGAFYGGMKYGSSHFTGQLPNGARAFGQGFTGQGSAARTGRNGAGVAGGFVSGDIISADSASITVKLSDGSTKIILVTNTTKVMKSVDGALADLQTGQTITVTGTANADGSITAESVQLRPAGSPTPGDNNQTAPTTPTKSN